MIQITRLALFWAIAGALGTLAGFPYLVALNQATLPPLPLPVLAIASTVQSGVVLFLLSWVGLWLGRSLKDGQTNELALDTPIARELISQSKLPLISKSRLGVTIAVGSASGGLVLGLDLLFQPLMPSLVQNANLDIALWKRLLASFYGGITEELLLRLFLMTLIAWTLWKIELRRGEYPSPTVFWLAIAVSSLLFGVGHLPAVAAVWPLTPIVILRTIVLNFLPSLAFGLLYWQWGLEYAMLSHACADIVLQVLVAAKVS
jgi:hypothetical protein